MFVVAFLVLLVTLPPGAGTPAPRQGPPVHPRRLLVEIRPGVAESALADVHARAGARVLFDLRSIGWQVVELAPGRRAEARALYEASGAFARVEPDRQKRLAYDPNDPKWPSMWHMRTIRADDAWDTHKGDPSVVIAILDTGVEVAHPDLAANVWVNPGEVPGNGVDDDGNGYVDDVNGYDFAYLDPDPDDVFGHGTACAGIAAAVQDNGIGVTGVAPRCRVAALKAALDTGYLYDSAIVPGLVYSADMGFDVVSMSFYSDEVTPAERDAIEYCWSHGVLPVAAAGNDSQVLPYYPAAYDRVVAVAATGMTDNKASFSNYGSWVDVGAPGVSLRTCSTGGGYTDFFAGTSGACPHVAGLAGLLFAAKPGAANAEVRAALEDGAVPLVQAPFGEYTNYGRIDCKEALDRVLGASSGPKPGRLLFAGPVAGGAPPVAFQVVRNPLPRGVMRLCGVGFEDPSTRVLRAGQPLPLLEQTRNWLVVPAANGDDLVEVEIQGQVIGSFRTETDAGYVYAPSDAGTQGTGAVPSGGFQELYRNDGQVFTCTPRVSGTYFVQFVLRKLEARPVSALELEFTRAYDDTSGVETLRLYDWSTASYPYGSWVTVSTSASTGPQMQTIQAALISAPERFLDADGSVYVELSTTGPGANALLRADSLRLRVR